MVTILSLFGLMTKNALTKSELFPYLLPSHDT